MFLNIACLLWAFDIEAPLDAQGHRILPDSNMDHWKGINPTSVTAFGISFHTADIPLAE